MRGPPGPMWILFRIMRMACLANNKRPVRASALLNLYKLLTITIMLYSRYVKKILKRILYQSTISRVIFASPLTFDYVLRNIDLGVIG